MQKAFACDDCHNCGNEDPDSGCHHGILFLLYKEQFRSGKAVCLAAAAVAFELPEEKELELWGCRHLDDDQCQIQEQEWNILSVDIPTFKPSRNY